MLRKYSKTFLVPFINARCCLYIVLSGPFGRNFMWNETYSEKSVKIGGCLFSVFHGTGVLRKESNPYLKKSMGINIPGFSHLIRPFTEFNHAMRNSCKKNYHPLNVAYHRMEIRWNRSTNSLEKVWVSIGSYHRTDFAALSHVMRNSWENPGMSHVTQSTIGSKFHGKEQPYFWEQYGYLYSSFLPRDGLCYIFPYY